MALSGGREPDSSATVDWERARDSGSGEMYTRWALARLWVLESSIR